MIGESSYVERAPAPELAALASSVWIQQVGARPVRQRHVPHGGAELRCVLGGSPRLLGPLTSATHRSIPPGGTVIGVRLRPGALGALVTAAADELVDDDVDGADVWSGQARLTDLLGEATTPKAALARLESFVAGSARSADPMVAEAVRHLMPWGGGTGVLPARLSISERHLRRRCRAAVGVGPKELERIRRFAGFIARVQASVAESGAAARGDLAQWAAESGYHDQAHLSRECRRLAGSPPGEVLAQYGSACACGHDHAASYRPMLPPWLRGRFVQEAPPVPA